ncbi:hypothetical protein [Arthrobacter sp. JSM 101049]|uniref:hypothetical protein n=1 Tax=Arthrobacter sp. JSM 101049 TaxID=929097 RepID=UPI00356AB21F
MPTDRSGDRPAGNPNLDDIIDPEGTALPGSDRRGHAKVPEDLDDDDFAAAEQEERVAAGLQDYAPGQVPPATDPVPPEAGEEAERAPQGLTEESEEESDG